MNDALLVHELDALTDLAHEHGTGPFRQNEIVVDDPFEQLAAFDSETEAQPTGDFHRLDDPFIS